MNSQSGSTARHITLLLLLGAACYFGVNALYGRIDRSIVADPRPLPQDREVQVVMVGGATDDQVSGSAKEAITKRNLFLPLNGANAADYSPALLTGPESSDGSLLLMGTIMETGGVDRAVILDVEGKQQHLVQKGDEINGARVMKITPGKIVISLGGQNQLLDVDEALKLRSLAAGEPASGSGVTGVVDIPTVSPNRGDKDSVGEIEPLQIDLGELQETKGRIFVKGRINKDI